MPGKAARASDQPDPQNEAHDEDDVEGHSLFLDPTVSRELASSRSREIERQVRDQQRAREARSKDAKRR
jgi:hypothetical protein